MQKQRFFCQQQKKRKKCREYTFFIFVKDFLTTKNAESTFFVVKKSFTKIKICLRVFNKKKDKKITSKQNFLFFGS